MTEDSEQRLTREEVEGHSGQKEPVEQVFSYSQIFAIKILLSSKQYNTLAAWLQESEVLFNGQRLWNKFEYQLDMHRGELEVACSFLFVKILFSKFYFLMLFEI